MTTLLIITALLVVFVIYVSFGKNDKDKLKKLPIRYGHGDYDITLVNITSGGKIQAAKLLCSYMEVGLKESNYIIQNLPYTFMKNVDKNYAEKLKQSFEIIGAKIEIKKSKENN